MIDIFIPTRRIICPRCGRPRNARLLRQRESVRDRFRVPGTYWPSRQSALNTARPGKVQKSSTGKLLKETTGRVKADSAKNENCCCLPKCGSCLDDQADITASVSSVALNSGCLISAFAFGTNFWVSPIVSTFSGTFTLSFNESLSGLDFCTWTYYGDPSPWFNVYSDSSCVNPITAYLLLWLGKDPTSGNTTGLVIYIWPTHAIGDGSPHCILFAKTLSAAGCQTTYSMTNAETSYSTGIIGKNGSASVVMS